VAEPKIHRQSENLPLWAKLWLLDDGIGSEFDVDNLTDEKQASLGLLGLMLKRVKEGAVEVLFDPAKDDEPRFRLTEKGRRRFLGAAS
jgi:hypothetical protein